MLRAKLPSATGMGMSGYTHIIRETKEEEVCGWRKKALSPIFKRKKGRNGRWMN
jgi:hypothetical protein